MLHKKLEPVTRTLMITHSLARSTMPPAVRSNIEVIARQGMASLAMGLAGIDSRRAIAAQHILLMCYSFKMIGIDTWRILAQVIKFQSFGNKANPRFVSEAMGLDGAAIVATEGAVAILINSARPQPTAVRLHGNFAEEASKCLHVPTFSIPCPASRESRSSTPIQQAVNPLSQVA